MNLTTYKGSGKISPSTLLWLPLVLAGAAALGWLYTMVLYINPLIYLSVLIFAGFCYLLGLISEKTIKLCHCRNGVMAMLIGLIFGIGILYFSHVSLYVHLTDIEISELLLDPGSVWSLANYIADHGYFSIEGGTVKGTVLWGVWGVEALGLLGIPLYMCHKYSTTTVYCETCQKWAEEDKDVLLFSVSDDKNIDQQFKTGDLSFIENGSALTNAEANREGVHFSVDEEWCKECKDLFTLSLRKHVRSISDKKLKVSTKTLVEDLVVDKNLHETLRSMNLTSQASTISFIDILGGVLARMSLSDGDVDETERSQMLSICNSFTESPLSEEDISAYIEDAQADNMSTVEYAAQWRDTINVDGKALIIKAALMVAFADGEFSEQEKELLIAVADGLGLSQDQFDVAIKEVMSE